MFYLYALIMIVSGLALAWFGQKKYGLSFATTYLVTSLVSYFMLTYEINSYPYLSVFLGVTLAITLGIWFFAKAFTYILAWEIIFILVFIRSFLEYFAKVLNAPSSIVSFGKIIKEAYAAADALAKEGVSCEVIDLRTVRPLDIDTILQSVKKTNRLVILEEAWPFGNVSTEITYQVQEKAFDYLDAPIIKINTADTPAPYSPVLLKEWLPNSDDVIKAVKKVMYK